MRRRQVLPLLAGAISPALALSTTLLIDGDLFAAVWAVFLAPTLTAILVNVFYPAATSWDRALLTTLCLPLFAWIALWWGWSADIARNGGLPLEMGFFVVRSDRVAPNSFVVAVGLWVLLAVPVACAAWLGAATRTRRWRARRNADPTG